MTNHSQYTFNNAVRRVCIGFSNEMDGINRVESRNGEIQMKASVNKVSAKAAQGNVAHASDTVVTGTVQRLKNHSQIRGEGYDNGIRHCVVALINNGHYRDHIAEVFEGIGIPFPSIIAPHSEGLWSFKDWQDWAAAEAIPY